VEDHVHCFFGLIPKTSFSDAMKNARAKSPKWINESELLAHKFEWQKGFRCFSYSQSQIDKVFKYIQNQEAHHKKETFRDEYTRILKACGIEYNEKYPFEDLI
jgi:putative transposase